MNPRLSGLHHAQALAESCRLLVFPIALLATVDCVRGQFVWDDGGDKVSVFQEANWTADGGAAGTDPPANSINGAADVMADCIVGDDTQAGGSGGAGNHFDLGDGYSLTITDDASWLSQVAGGYGIRGASGGAVEQLVLSSTGTVTTTFLLDIEVSLSASVELILLGGGTPVNASSIDLDPAWSGVLRFSAETVADVQAEHLSKITVNGSPAVDSGAGQNIDLLSDGSAGSYIRLYTVPADTDMDGMEDGWEIDHFGDLSRDGTLDFDGDGLLDLAEFNAGTDPTDSDSDDDLLLDGEEGPLHGTDPADPDSDDDGNPDGFEVAKGLDPTDPASRVDRPNIIFVLTDDLGYGDLGVLFQNGKSGKKHLTPNLDQIAADGLVLNQHYCPAPVCAPSRGSLLQGVHQGHANIRDNQFDKALQDNHTLATTLRAAGYSTALIGKYGMQGSGGSPSAWPAYPTKRGFDYFFGYVRHADGHTHYPAHVTDSRGTKELYDQAVMIRDDLDKCYTADLFMARAKKLIVDETTANPLKPFFLFLAFDTPHAALQLPTVAYPSGAGTSGGLQWNGTPGSMINTATGTIDSYRHPDYTTAVGGAWTDVEERFATCVRRIDDCVGDLRQTLVDLAIDDNTLIVFSSDNGPHSEDYLTTAQTYDGSSYAPTSFDSYGPHEGMKRDTWEGGIREPTLVWGPGIVGGASGSVSNPRIVNTPSQFHDWMPTFLELAGWTAPSRTDGVSLLPTIADTTGQKDGSVYVEYTTSGSTPTYGDFTNHGGDSRSQCQVIRVKGSDAVWYKGIRTNVGSHADDFEIYNVDSDLKEAIDLAGTSPFFDALQQEMKDRVLRIRQPDSSAPRAYDSALVQPVADFVEAGIEVSSYEGLWPWMPEFRDLTAVATGTDSNFNLTSLSRPDDAGLLFTGYINIPADGSWSFFSTSDTGIHLRIHDSQVIDDDFGHDGSEASGSIELAAGRHPFRLYYRSRSGTPSLDVQWSGPGTAKAPVPDSALFMAGTPPPEPIAADDAVAILQGSTEVFIPVLANDIDDGVPAPLSISSIGPVASGTATVVGDEIRYQPEASFLGTERFDYSITDGQFFDSATVTVIVNYQGADLWIPLNECGGSAVYEAGGYQLGDMSGGASRISGPPGTGMALSFDGINSEFSLPDAPGLPAGSAPRTIMCWVRVPTGEALENQTMFGYGANSSGARFSFRLNGSAGSNNPGTPNQAVRLEVQSGNIVGNGFVDDGLWHHVAAVCDDFDDDGELNVNETKLYIDGVVDTNAFDTADPIVAPAGGTAQVMNTAAGSVPVLGGSNHSGGYTFLGDIDELRLIPEALTTAQIEAEMNAGTPAADAWHRRFFGAATIDWMADSDMDGVSRLGELAFGGQPWINDAASLRPSFVINPATDRLEMSFRRRLAGTYNLLYTVQASNDLQGWDVLGTTEIGSTLLSAEECLEWATFELDATTSEEPRQFSRVMVELP